MDILPRIRKGEGVGRRKKGERADVCGFVFVFVFVFVDLLLVAWPYNGDIVHSTRYAT